MRLFGGNHETMSQEQLFEAKRQLYFLLLQKDVLTDNEVELMFYLSKDEQIQELFKNP